MNLDKEKAAAFGRFLNAPVAPVATAPTLQNPNFRFRLLREVRAGVASEEDLWALVHLSHDSPRIRRANALTLSERFGLYSMWYEANKNCIMLIERVPADVHGTSIVGSTIILPFKQAEFDLIETGALPVVDLQKHQICAANASYDVLLFDTWVVHNDYQDFERSWFLSAKYSHQGFANVLPLRHLGLLWEPAQQPSLTVYAEPDSLSMQKTLGVMGFEPHATTAIGEPLLRLRYPLASAVTAQTALDHRRLEEIVLKIAACRGLPLA